MTKAYEVCPVGCKYDGIEFGQFEWDQYIALCRSDDGLTEEELEGMEDDPEACGEDIAARIEDGKITLDARTPSQRKMDAIAKGGVTKLDKQFGYVKTAAEKTFGNGKKVYEHLLFAEESSIYLEMYTTDGGKRSAGVSRLSELLVESGYSPSDISMQGINDHIGAFRLALLVTDCNSVKTSKRDDVKTVPKDWINSVAWRTLEKLKFGIESDGDAYSWKAGWAVKIREWISAGVRGGELDVAFKAHKESVAKMKDERIRSSLSPQQADLYDRNKIAKEKEKLVKAANDASEAVIEATKKANMSPDDIMLMLVNRGVVLPHAGSADKVEPTLDNMSPAFLANAIDVTFATQFSTELVQRGNKRVIEAMCSILRGWLIDNQDVPTATPEPETANV